MLQSKKQLNYRKLLLHPRFTSTLNDLNKLKISLPNNPIGISPDFELYNFSKGNLVTTLEDINVYELDANEGSKHANDKFLISGYDESINKFMGLEGTAFSTSHSIVIHDETDFIPINLLTFYFYTRSTVLSEKSDFIKYSERPEEDSKKDYVVDRREFLINNTPKNSVLLIDGPLIGGQVSYETIKMNDKLLDNNILPIYFVKNSASNLVTDNIKEIRGKYNSDMHWSFVSLRPGQRTNLFRYVEKGDIMNRSKVFFYLKGFEVSPQRVELHPKTFEKYSDVIYEILDLIYYLLLAQGNPKNPQLRTIAIAEKYARETLHIMNINKILRSFGIMPTMNQERFAM